MLPLFRDATIAANVIVFPIHREYLCQEKAQMVQKSYFNRSLTSAWRALDKKKAAFEFTG
jgi:hypothetical protein